MHILYIHQYFVPPDGSGGTRSLEMARRMVRAGHRVTFVTSSSFFPKHYHFTEGINLLTIEDFELYVIKISYSNKMSYFDRIMAFLKFAVNAFYAINKIKNVDVIFATSTPLTVIFPAVWAKVRNRAPIIFEVRDLWPELPIAMKVIRNPLLIAISQLMERFAYQQAKGVVALSPGMAEGVKKTGYPANRIAIVPNSSDLDLFRIPSSNENLFLEKFPEFKERKLVVYTGTFGPINGVDYLVHVAEQLKKLQSDIFILVVGSGREEEKIRNLAIEKGVLNVNFFMLPPQPKKLLPYLYQAAQACCSLFIDIPEMWNNSANKFFDALAAKKPVIINYKGWQAKILNDNKAGLILPYGNYLEAAKQILELIDSPERVREYSENAGKLADVEFDRDILAGKLIKFIEDNR